MRHFIRRASRIAKERYGLMADIRVAAKSGDEPKKKPARRATPNIPGSSAFKGGTVQFLKEAWVEVFKKTTWPTKPELIRSTTVVLAVVIGISLYLAAWDLIGSIITGWLFR